MTHYKQCCARECEWCAKGWPEMTDGRHIAPLFQPYEVKPCTAPTLSEFAERCAEALTEIANHPHNDYQHPANKSDDTYGIGTADGHRCAAMIARRALGLEKE